MAAAATPLPALYAQVWHHACGVRRRMGIAMAMLTGSQLLRLAMPWMAAQAINRLQAQGTDALPQAGAWIGGIFALAIGMWALHGPGRVIERGVAVHVRRQVADALFARLAAAPLAWHDRHHSGELQHRAQLASSALYEFTQSQFIYLQSAVNLLGPVVALALLSPATGVVALIGYAAIIATIVFFDAALMRWAERENRELRGYAARLVDFLGNIGALAALRLQAAARKLLDARMADVSEPLARSIRLTEWKWGAMDLASIALSWGLVVLYVLAERRAGEALLLGNLFMVYQYTQQAAGVVASMAGNYQALARRQTDFAGADEIWQAPRAQPVADADADWRRLEVQGLAYRHPPRKTGNTPFTLSDIDLALAPGEWVALVGESGCGKSSLLRVLAGLYAADAGEVRVDGGRRDGLRSWAPWVRLVPQEAELFELSLRDNLTFGEPIAGAELDEAIHLSAFDSVPMALPQGLETSIQERGFNLSGGQRQRLALARGLLAARRAGALLLDEPTSALDDETQQRVHARLRATRPLLAVVASVHRLSLLTHFDRVLLMREGRVVDQGPVAAMIARHPHLAANSREASSV